MVKNEHTNGTYSSYTDRPVKKKKKKMKTGKMPGLK